MKEYTHESEFQVSEAPDVCCIVRGNALTSEVWVERFEDEDGEIMAPSDDMEFEGLLIAYREDIESGLYWFRKYDLNRHFV